MLPPSIVTQTRKDLHLPANRRFLDVEAMSRLVKLRNHLLERRYGEHSRLKHF